MFHLRLGSAVQENFLHKGFEGKTHDKGDNCGRAHIHKQGSNSSGILEVGFFPCLPEIQDDGDHRARVKHHEQECHGWTGGIQSHQFFSHNDMCGAGYGKKFRRALDEAKEEDLKDVGFHMVESDFWELRHWD